MSGEFDRERVVDLTGQLCDQEISEEDLAELEAALKNHRQAR